MSKRCTKCGETLSDTAKFCNKCGQRTSDSSGNTAASPQNAPGSNSPSKQPQARSAPQWRA